MPIGVSADNNKRRETFFRFLFGNSSGYICLSYGGAGAGNKKFNSEYFKYPEEMPQLLQAINKIHLGNNVWFCPQLLSEKTRQKEYVSSTPVAWADLDTCPPEKMLVKPSMVVESSPGRYQAYWKIENVGPSDAEDLCRRIAYHHADDGADRTGWDLTQLLRVPLTYNYKYGDDQEVPVVEVIQANKSLFRMKDFEVYPQAQGYEHLDVPFPTKLPEEDAEDLLQKHRLKVNAIAFQLFSMEPSKDWSSALWQLHMVLFEAGFTREEVYIVASAAKCNKYARDGKPNKLLWKDVCRANARFEEQTRAIVPKDFIEAPLVTDEERDAAFATETFIERYMDWAKSLGDAAVQYHQAGAFVALSSLLSGSIRLPTSFGTVIPNLWFMILADTTLTRKTTAMDITMDIVSEIDPDVVLATDGSIEGLLTQMTTRPSRPSIFLRDEFSGLLEMMTKRDYYAGMPEMLTKLYDGKMQKRVLRKEILEVRDPILIIFAGGIRNKITSLLNMEHVSSGFMPRFVFITAESDITRLKPLGPPTEQLLGNREAIKNELEDLFKHYHQEQTMNINDKKVSVTAPIRWNARLSPDAWARYNKLETQMLGAGLEADLPEIMTPMYDRLSKSILKAAVLLAATRRQEQIVVEEADIIRAATYGESWRMYAREILNSVGRGDVERQLDKLYQAIVKKEGVTRSVLMQNYHLTARDADMYFITLEQRGLITRQKDGRTELLYANKAPRSRRVKVG